MSLSSTAREKEQKTESFFTCSKQTEGTHVLSVLNIPETNYFIALREKRLLEIWLCEENQFKQIRSIQIEPPKPKEMNIAASFYIDANGDLVVFIYHDTGIITLVNFALSSDIEKINVKSVSEFKCDLNTTWSRVQLAPLADGGLAFLAQGDLSHLCILKKGEKSSQIFNLKSFFYKMNNLFLLPDNNLLIVGQKKSAFSDSMFLLDLNKLLQAGSFSKEMIEKEITFEYLGTKDLDVIDTFKLQNGKIAVSCEDDKKSRKIFMVDAMNLVEKSAIELCDYNKESWIDGISQAADGRLLVVENTYGPYGACLVLSKHDARLAKEKVVETDKIQKLTGGVSRMYQPVSSPPAVESKSKPAIETDRRPA